MANVSYTPTFRHKAWRDRQDRVEAAGPNGFNVRFAAIESDLHQISTVVGQIGTEIDGINAKVNPPPRERRLSFTPTLQTVPPGKAWNVDGQGDPSNIITGTTAVGLVNLDLPHGARLTTFQVTYSKTRSFGSEDSFSLLRAPLRPTIPPIDADVLVNLPATQSQEVHLSGTVSAAQAQVDLDAFRYFAVAVASSEVTFRTFVLTYLA